MDDFTIQGAEKLGQAAKALRAAGGEGGALRKELLKGIRTAAGGPMRKAAREAWKTNAPKRGGLNKVGLRMTVQTNTRNGADLGVRLVTKSAAGYDMKSINDGLLRHRVFGSGTWVEQRIPAHIISDAQESVAPLVRKEVVNAIESVLAKIVKEAG